MVYQSSKMSPIPEPAPVIVPSTRPTNSLSARLLLQVQVLQHSGTRQAKQQYRMEQYGYHAVFSPSVSFAHICSCPSLLLAIDKRRNGVRQGRTTRLPCHTQVPLSSPSLLSLSLSLSLTGHGPYDHCRARSSTSLTAQTRQQQQ